jgi:hypothetical protein
VTRVPSFKSKLRPLTILELERLSPAARDRREAEEERERRDWDAEQRRIARPKPAGARS